MTQTALDRAGSTDGSKRRIRATRAAADSAAQTRFERTVLRNATPDRLHITDADDKVLVLAPLQTHPIDEGKWQGLLDRGILVREEDALRWVQCDLPEKGSRFSRRIAQTVMLLATMVISVGIPVIALHQDLMHIQAPLLVVAFVAVATMVPGLLFVMFDRQRLSTLRDRFEQQIFRLDPNLRTLADVYARYGSQINEAYFAPDGKTTASQATQRRGPVVLATFTLALGWVIALTTVRLDAGPTTPASIIAAVSNPVAFAFLGAYFYSINLCLRRYSRNDLRPKAYSAITVRVLISIVLAYLLEATVTVLRQDNPALLATAFLIGIVPETALTLLRETYKNQAVKRAADELDEPQPLRCIEGMDIYDRSRLLDEGVVNVESLAHDDLIDLLLETRIAPGRLVDWTDQSILYLHLVEPYSATATAGTPTPGQRARTKLRQLHIRTATELKQAYERPCMRDVLTEAVRHDGDAPGVAEQRLKLLILSFSGEQWLPYIESWRDRGVVRDRYLTLDAAGRITSNELAVPTAPGLSCSSVTSSTAPTAAAPRPPAPSAATVRN